MTSRRVLLATTVTLLATPHITEPQPPGKVFRLGYLSAAPPTPSTFRGRVYQTLVDACGSMAGSTTWRTESSRVGVVRLPWWPIGSRFLGTRPVSHTPPLN